MEESDTGFSLYFGVPTVCTNDTTSERFLTTWINPGAMGNRSQSDLGPLPGVVMKLYPNTNPES